MNYLYRVYPCAETQSKPAAPVQAVASVKSNMVRRRAHGLALPILAFTAAFGSALPSAADDTVYSLDYQFDLPVGSRHFQRIKMESSIADTLHTGATSKNAPTRTAGLEVIYEVEIVEKKPNAGPTRAVFIVKSGKATVNGAPSWAPRPDTRMDVRRTAEGYEVDGFPAYLDPAVAELIRITFSQVSDEFQMEHDAFMPDSAKIGDVWGVDLEAFRRMQRGHALLYDEAKLEGSTSLAARATLGNTDVLILETRLTADGIRLTPEPGLPKIAGTGQFTAQVVVPIDTTLGPKRFKQESNFVLRSQPRNGKFIERNGSGSIQIDFDYPDQRARTP